MKTIPADEFNSMPLHGYGRSTPYYNKILSLKPGDDAVVITIEEWGDRKYPPTRLSSRIAKKYGYKFRQGRTPDKSGWAIGRVK